MGKLLGMVWLIGLGVVLAMALVLAFVTAMLHEFGFTFSTTGTYVLGGIVGVIAGFACIPLVHEAIDLYASRGGKLSCLVGNTFWQKRYDERRPVKGYQVQLMLLHILWFAVCIWIVMVMEQEALDPFVRADTEGWFVTLSATMAAAAVFFTMAWILLAGRFFRATCHKCGSVMFKKQIGSENLYHNEHDEHKSHDTHGVIGTLYVNGEKVGDVTGKTGSVEYSRHVSVWGGTDLLVCTKCGKKSKVSWRHSHSTEWKQE